MNLESHAKKKAEEAREEKETETAKFLNNYKEFDFSRMTYGREYSHAVYNKVSELRHSPDILISTVSLNIDAIIEKYQSTAELKKLDDEIKELDDKIKTETDPVVKESLISYKDEVVDEFQNHKEKNKSYSIH